MANFIKIADLEETCDFIDLDQVTKVSCTVRRHQTGGGLNIESFSDPSVPRSTPSRESVTAVIILHTSGGTGELRFSDLDEAAQWAQENLGIAVPFDQF
ncbi:hypothetical protein [Massilia sp. SYSU DXS3249]